MNHPLVEISEVADIQIGPFGSLLHKSDYITNGVAVINPMHISSDGIEADLEYSISEDNAKKLVRYRLKTGEVIMGRRGEMGRCAVVEPQHQGMICGTGSMKIIPSKPSLDPTYLMHVLKAPAARDRLENAASGVTMLNLNAKALAAIEIPLPPLPEQKRIAAILDAADALRAKRSEAIAQLDTLLQSTFLDMFGDPVTNPMGWEVRPLSFFVKRLDGGKNIAQSETETTHRVLKVSAVTSGRYLPGESKYLPEEFEVPDSYLVKKGDLLISRANTAELIGATAYVWDTPECMVLPDKIWKFIWKEKAELSPLYFYHLSQNFEFRRELSKRASGTSGSMKNIAKPKLLSMPVITPGIEAQETFVNLVRAVESQLNHTKRHLAELNTLFASLQQRAFNGTL